MSRNTLIDFENLGLHTWMVFSSRTFQHLSWGVAFCFICIWSTYLTFGTSPLHLCL